jgi:L-asparaginase II
VPHVVVAEVVRSGFVEGCHWGSAVVVDPDGAVRWSLGDPAAAVFPRTCNKPIQAVAMVRAGLALRGRMLALCCASHSGEPFHLEGVREILGGAGLDETALQTPSDWPVEPRVRTAYLLAGGEPAPVAMNCSGKHAGMLATCVVNDWDVGTYREAAHPLQRRIVDTFEELTGEPVTATGVDGCGAPVLGSTLTGLARAFGRLRSAPAGTAEHAVAEAVSGFPTYVSGTQRDEALLIRAIPGAVAKIGAEACYALALPDGTAVALKIADGGDRARPVLMSAILRRLGHDGPVLEQVGRHTILGHGEPVGEVRAVV